MQLLDRRPQIGDGNSWFTLPARVTPLPTCPSFLLAIVLHATAALVRSTRFCFSPDSLELIKMISRRWSQKTIQDSRFKIQDPYPRTQWWFLRPRCGKALGGICSGSGWQRGDGDLTSMSKHMSALGTACTRPVHSRAQRTTSPNVTYQFWIAITGEMP